MSVFDRLIVCTVLLSAPRFMPWQSDDWKRLVDSATWIRSEQRVHGPRLRCGVCRSEFVPAAHGASAFTDELKAIRLTVCPLCEPRLVLRSAETLRQRAQDARHASDNAIERANDVLNRSIDQAGRRALGPAPVSPDSESAPERERARSLVKKDD